MGTLGVYAGTWADVRRRCKRRASRGLRAESVGIWDVEPFMVGRGLLEEVGSSTGWSIFA
jgi:hypothetical protein